VRDLTIISKVRVRILSALNQTSNENYDGLNVSDTKAELIGTETD
jgi:hypothetical protein